MLKMWGWSAIDGDDISACGMGEAQLQGMEE